MQFDLKRLLLAILCFAGAIALVREGVSGLPGAYPTAWLFTCVGICTLFRRPVRGFLIALVLLAMVVFVWLATVALDSASSHRPERPWSSSASSFA